MTTASVKYPLRFVTRVARFTCNPERQRVAFEVFMVEAWLLIPALFYESTALVAWLLFLAVADDRLRNDTTWRTHTKTSALLAWQIARSVVMSVCSTLATARRIIGRYLVLRRTKVVTLRGERQRNRLSCAIRAIRPEVGLTPTQRQARWFARMCEVRHIVPAPVVTAYERVDDGRKLTLRMNAAGMTVDQFRHYAKGIALYIGQRCLGVRIVEHATNPETCFLYIVERDLLKDSLGDWPDLATAAGERSIVDGIRVGKDAGTRDVYLDVVNDAVFVAGQRGTGKSSFLQQIVAGAALCNDVELWLGDMKEGVEFWYWRNHVARFTDDPESALAMVTALEAERRSRSARMKAQDIKKWHPGCGFPFILCVIDEVADIGEHDGPEQALLTKIVRLGRAQGIGLILATQRPVATEVSTTLRAQCNVGVSFRVRDANETSIALGPGASQLGLYAHRLPKHQFLMLGNDEQEGTRGRGWYLSDAHVAAIVAKLPLLASEQSAVPSESDADRTVQDQHIEPPAEPEQTASDPVTPAGASTPAPPADIAANPDHLALWNALPGYRRQLCARTKYQPSQVSKILGDWAARGLVINPGGHWEHRREMRSVA